MSLDITKMTYWYKFLRLTFRNTLRIHCWFLTCHNSFCKTLRTCCRFESYSDRFSDFVRISCHDRFHCCLYCSKLSFHCNKHSIPHIRTCTIPALYHTHSRFLLCRNSFCSVFCCDRTDYTFSIFHNR